MKLRGRVILCIDTDVEFRQELKSIIVAEGGIFLEAKTVDDAIKICQHEFPHLILSELVLEIETFFDFIEAKEDYPSLKLIPTVIITSVKKKELIAKAVSLGISGFIPKPFDSNKLLEKIQQLTQTSCYGEYVFSKEERPEVSTEIDGEMIEMNQVRCFIKAPVKFSQKTELIAHSSFLNQLGLNRFHLKTRKEGRMDDKKNYNTDMIILGMNEKTATEIDKLPKKPK